MKIHKGCGGRIENRKCDKCGKVWKRLGWVLGSGVEDKMEKFDEKAYKKRIREMRDIERK